MVTRPSKVVVRVDLKTIVLVGCSLFCCGLLVSKWKFSKLSLAPEGDLRGQNKLMKWTCVAALSNKKHTEMLGSMRNGLLWVVGVSKAKRCPNIYSGLMAVSLDARRSSHIKVGIWLTGKFGVSMYWCYFLYCYQ